MTRATLKIGSPAGIAIAVLVLLPLAIIVALLYAIQGPDKAVRQTAVARGVARK